MANLDVPCPKCGAINNATASTCRSCSTNLLDPYGQGDSATGSNGGGFGGFLKRIGMRR